MINSSAATESLLSIEDQIAKAWLLREVRFLPIIKMSPCAVSDWYVVLPSGKQIIIGNEDWEASSLSQNSPPVELASQNFAECMPKGDPASAGGETDFVMVGALINGGQVMYMSQHEAEFLKQAIKDQIAPFIKRIEALEAMSSAEGQPTAYKCLARIRAACNWPDCGCDPYATKVISALVDNGWTAPPECTPSPNQETGK